METKKIVVEADKLLGSKAGLLVRKDGSVQPDRSAVAKVIVKPHVMPRA